MNRYENITNFLNNGYMDFLLQNNITMVHFKNRKTITFLIYQDELFIFNSVRSINQAYKFYNVDKELCLEGVEYFKITKNCFSYVNPDDINIKKGKVFSVNDVDYLINYHSKGYKNENNLSLAKVNKLIFNLLDFCQSVTYNGLDIDDKEEKIAIVSLENKDDYVVDLYQIDSIEPMELSNKFSVDKEFRELVSNKEAVLEDARIGIFFTDGYKDCLTLESTRSGGFIYYSLGDDNLMVYKFETISLKLIYIVLQELFSEFIPVTLSTDNEFLFDVLNKTFDGKIDFILDKTNRYSTFIRELGVVLTLNNYADYKMDAFCLIIENNFNSIINDINNFSVIEFNSLLNECIQSYRINELDEFEDDFDEFEVDEEEVIDSEVDTTLLS